MIDDAVASLLTFDQPERFPVLESFTTFQGSYTIRAAIAEGGSTEAVGMSVDLQEAKEFLPESAVVLSMPLTTLGGEPDRIGLECIADGSGIGVFLEGRDGSGSGFTQRFPLLGNTGWVCVWITAAAGERWSRERGTSATELRLPLQWQRLGIQPLKQSGPSRIVLVRLVASGRPRTQRADWA